MRKLEWQVYYYNINQKRIETFNVFQDGGFKTDLDGILKRNKTRTKLAEEEIKRSVMYYFRSKSDLCPWIDKNNNEMKISVYDQLMLNWNQFLDYIFESSKIMNEDIVQALRNIQENIDDLQKQQKMLENINEKESLTEAEWHQLCLTPVRNTKTMETFLKNIFPNAENVTNNANQTSFTLYDFKCALPTTFRKNIMVNMSWNQQLTEPTVERFMSNSERKMREYFKLLDSHGYWLELFDLRFSRFQHYKKWIKFILWFVKYKWKNDHREKWKEEFKKTEKKFETELLKYKQEKINLEKKREIFKKKLLPELYQFTNEVVDENGKKIVIS